MRGGINARGAARNGQVEGAVEAFAILDARLDRRRHFRARIPLFQTLAAPFPAGPLGSSPGVASPRRRSLPGRLSLLSLRDRKAVPRPDPLAAGKDFRAGRKEFQAGRKEFQAGRKENQIRYKENQVFSFRNSRLFRRLTPISPDKAFAATLAAQRPPGWPGSPVFNPGDGHIGPGRASPTAPAAVPALPISIASMGTMITQASIFRNQMFERIRALIAGRADHQNIVQERSATSGARSNGSADFRQSPTIPRSPRRSGPKLADGAEESGTRTVREVR